MTDVTWNPAGDDDTSFGPLTAHNVLGGRTAADAHPATAVSYDHTVSGLAGDTVQEAIDELATSGGAVASVNGQTGVVVLDAGDVGAVPTTRTVNGNALSTDVTLDATDVGAVPTARTITAGTGLTGGGDLSADRTLTVTYGTTAGTAAAGDDARLSDARTPTAHEASHHHDGSDPLDAGDVGAVPVESVGLLPGETNRGTWDVAATYAVGDVVFETGSDLYIATAPSTGDQPSLTPGSWDVLDPTGRHVRLGPGATSGDYGTAVGPSATSGDYGTAVGLGATSGDFGTAVGLGATSGDFGTAVGPSATAGDYEVNVANTYRATLDPGDPATPLTATIATGHVDLPETADVTNPAADHQRLVARTDGLYVRDQTGTEVGPLGAAHAASHQDGGSDELALDGSQITTGTVGAARLPRITPTVYTGSSAPWVATAVGTATGNGGLDVAYRMAFLPIELTARPWDRCGVTTTAAGAGTSWEIGIYDLLSNGEPGAQAASFGTLDMSLTAGDQDLTISFTPATTRWFWLGIKVTAFGSAPTVRVAGATGPAPRLPGWPHRRNGDTFAGLAVTSGLAAGPLPAVAPTVGTTAGQATYSPSLPIVYMRAA